jgi:transposase
MSKGKEVKLSEEQRRELEWMRDHHPKPYMRPKAAAILKVADGESRSQVAARGLLKPVYYETVSGWITRYLEEGVAGLQVKAGRGRKPVFSPSR